MSGDEGKRLQEGERFKLTGASLCGCFGRKAVRGVRQVEVEVEKNQNQ